uniref:Glycosyltransferase WbuB n=1 Tax=Geoglobus ahangari TaxID=113653 RepID=A0A7C3UCZ6_9EURY
MRGRKLNILLINNYFPPEIGAASHLYYYLAKELIARGHNVKVLTGIPRYNVSRELYESYVSKARSSKHVLNERHGDIEVIRVKLPFVDRKNFIRRGLEHFEIAYKLFYSGSSYVGKPDVSLVYSPPLTLFWTAKKIREKTGAPFVLNVQDLFPQAAIDLGVMKNKLLIRFFRSIERKAYETADLITVHSEKNRAYVENIIQDEEKVIVFENWIDDQEITPGSKDNPFCKRNGLNGKFVVSFAGTLGVSQDIEVIIKAANELKNIRDIVFIIVGDGVRKEQTEKMIKQYSLDNVRVLPTVPLSEYAWVLHSSDVSLATLVESVRTPVVPSKILSIMSAGIPVIATMNLDGDAPELIQRAKCGYVFGAGDYKNLASAILELYSNPELRERLGRNGRKYIEEHLSARKAAERYEQLFYKLIEDRR